MSDKSMLKVGGTITIEVDGQKMELSISQAKYLMSKLQEVFNHQQIVPYYTPQYVTFTGDKTTVDTTPKITC